MIPQNPVPTADTLTSAEGLAILRLQTAPSRHPSARPTVVSALRVVSRASTAPSANAPESVTARAQARAHAHSRNAKTAVEGLVGISDPQCPIGTKPGRSNFAPAAGRLTVSNVSTRPAAPWQPLRASPQPIRLAVDPKELSWLGQFLHHGCCPDRRWSSIIRMYLPGVMKGRKAPLTTRRTSEVPSC